MDSQHANDVVQAALRRAVRWKEAGATLEAVEKRLQTEGISPRAAALTARQAFRQSEGFRFPWPQLTMLVGMSIGGLGFAADALMAQYARKIPDVVNEPVAFEFLYFGGAVFLLGFFPYLMGKG